MTMRGDALKKGPVRARAAARTNFEEILLSLAIPLDYQKITIKECRRILEILANRAFFAPASLPAYSKETSASR